MDQQVMEPPPLSITTDPRWLAAERVANSRCFQRSSRLRDFLLYIVRYELEGKASEISEQNIGERVYARRENYSPLDDNIVRVSARQLRLKLKEFYESDGRDDPWVIEIPKGGYVPIFHARLSAQEVTAAVVQPPSAPPRYSSKALWLTIPLAVAVTLLAVWWGVTNHDANTPKKAGPNNIVLAIFRRTEDPVQIVLSDPALSAMQNMVGHPFSLEDYSNGSYRDLPPNLTGSPEDAVIWHTLANQQLANLGDVGAALHLRDSLSILNSKQEPIVRSARDMRPRDFRSGDFIVLGGSLANPWTHLLEQEPLNFQFENATGPDITVANRNPAPGEPSAYPADNEGHGYARIALVPNLTRTGQALMIAGMSMESTEAAIDYCLSPDSMQLLASLHIHGTSDIPPFEALLRTTREGGTGVKAELVSVRLSVSK